ncbi:MAG: hypothetical protein JW395_4092 [Nitrospira sp.]|nr:hypothetical protein [Nitrospira sp.]
MECAINLVGVDNRVGSARTLDGQIAVDIEVTLRAKVFFLPRAREGIGAGRQYDGGHCAGEHNRSSQRAMVCAKAVAPSVLIVRGPIHFHYVEKRTDGVVARHGNVTDVARGEYDRILHATVT